MQPWRSRKLPSILHTLRSLPQQERLGTISFCHTQRRWTRPRLLAGPIARRMAVLIIGCRPLDRKVFL